MHIVLLDTDTYGTDIDLTALTALGKVTAYPNSTRDEIPLRIGGADVVVANKAPLDRGILEQAPHLSLICIAATGTNNVELPYCRERGIAVTNAAGYSTASVVQHSFAMLFYLLTALPYYDNYVKQREYEKSKIFTHFGPVFHELQGKVWGIVGMGAIGQGVAGAARAFGCEVIYCDPQITAADYPSLPLADLLTQADVLSLHLPLTPATKHLIDAAALAKMKPTAYLLNLARGGIVDEAALAEALLQEGLAGAALDVLEKEPIAPDSPLYAALGGGRLLITPHIAWASQEARQRLIQEVAENIKAFTRGDRRNRVE